MSKPAPISTEAANASTGGASTNSVPTSPSTTSKLSSALSNLGIGTKKQSADGLTTPTHEIAQTPALESGNPFDKHDIPTEARQQLVVGKVGEAVQDDNSKILLALDGTDAGEKAFNYVLNSKVLAKDAHIFSEWKLSLALAEVAFASLVAARLSAGKETSCVGWLHKALLLQPHVHSY